MIFGFFKWLWKFLQDLIFYYPEQDPPPEPKQEGTAAEPVKTEAKPKPHPVKPPEPKQKPVKRPTDRGPRNPHRGQARETPLSLKPHEKDRPQGMSR